MNIKLILISALIALSSSLLALQHGQLSGQQTAKAKTVKGVQVATVLVADGKYTPSVIQVKKGVPVAITFKGGKHMGCGSTIEFKTLKQLKSVKEGQSVVFQFTPSKAGEIKFACSMDMIRGKVIVK